MKDTGTTDNAPNLFSKIDGFNIAEPVRSPLNYIGGKYKILPQILKYFPTKINNFVDLFCGGCNVGINVNAQNAYFNDNLVYLINLYIKLKETPQRDVLEHIHDRINTLGLSLTNADAYLQLRKLYNVQKNPLDLFVLVAFSLNHQIRFNSNHQFNNPFGKDRSSFNPTMENNLLRFVERLQSINCEFTSLDFRDFNLENLTEDDLVYCDPPYLITTGTYNDGKRGFTGWSDTEEHDLLHILDTLNAKGVHFALSNVLTHKGKTNHLLIDWVNKNGYRVEHLNNNYANSNYHTTDRRRDASDEVLILNFTTQ